MWSGLVKVISSISVAFISTKFVEKSFGSFHISKQVLFNFETDKKQFSHFEHSSYYKIKKVSEILTQNPL